LRRNIAAGQSRATRRCWPIPRIEAIINTTPNDVHLATTSAAAAAGKHVFLDKPIANTISDGRAPGDNPDVASLIPEHNDGALSTVNASYASASEYYLMNIYGKDATAYYDLHNGLRLLKRGESEPTAIRCAKNNTLVEELEEFAAAARGGGQHEVGASTRRDRLRWCAPAFSRRGRDAGSRSRRYWTVTETCERAAARTPARREVSHWRLAAIVVALAVVAGIAPARAQAYPSRTITVVVPFPAGGASDVVARIVTNQMSKILEQSIVIENVGGAGGTLGSARVAAAPPDGYTLLAAAMGSHVAAPVLTTNIKYNPLSDFVPIGITADSPAVVIARKDFPAQDLKEFVAVLRQQGDAVKQAHGGIGSSSHMACLLFTTEIGAKPTLVPYRGSGPALNDLDGGHVDFMCEQSVSVADQVLAGSIKAYAVSAPERLAMLPNVPTAREAGINYDMSIWAGLFAPKGVPPEVITRLADALGKALDEPKVRDTLARLGGSVPTKAERSPAAFDRFVRSEIARWAPILTAVKAEK
jgi:tripartite-type tricarboxylate transporter receptor subunit TctC